MLFILCGASYSEYEFGNNNTYEVTYRIIELLQSKLNNLKSLVNQKSDALLVSIVKTLQILDIQRRWLLFIYSRLGMIISISGDESISSQSNMFCFGMISERGSYLSNLVVS